VNGLTGFVFGNKSRIESKANNSKNIFFRIVDVPLFFIEQLFKYWPLGRGNLSNKSFFKDSLFNFKSKLPNVKVWLSTGHLMTT
jgi:hypothetical protein